LGSNPNFGLESQVQVLRFFEQLNREGLSEARKRKYRTLLRKLSRMKIPCTQEGVDRFFTYLQNCDMTYETRMTQWYVFKKFMRFVNPELKWDYKLKFSVKRRLPDILTLEEVIKLINSATNLRDKTIVSLLFDSGMRPGELTNLKIEDVIFDEDGLIVNIDGKTGQRRIRVVNTVNSKEFLMEYLHYHRFKKDPYSPLFYRKDKKIKKKLTLEGLGTILKNIGKRAKMRKRIYSYLFRHSRATFLAKYLTEQEMKIYFGWTMGSGMVERYVHLSCRDLDQKVLELNNKPTQKEEKEDLRQLIREELLRVLKEI